jgi:serine/threonine protein kinase
MTACPVCQTPVQGNATICAVCGSPLKTKTTGPALAPGTRLDQGHYRIDSVLGQGGFGITYRAYDLELGREVAIKELFNAELNARQGNIVLSNVKGFQETIQDFLAEARLLAQFNHPGIIRIFDAFLENGTAYYTMELLNGQTLEERIAQSGPLPASEVQDLAIKLGQTLEVLHQRNLLHRDIKPANIFLSSDNRAILLDFGSAHQYQQNQTVNHTRLVTPGYAPLEQYQSQGKFGPFTDIYALSATLLHALTGTMPPDALSRLPQDAGGQGAPLPLLPDNTFLGEALAKGLALKPGERPQTIVEFVSLVEGESNHELPLQPRAPDQFPWRTPSEDEVFRAMIGPFAALYRKAFAKASSGRTTFHWSAFLFGPFWMFYRKLGAAGAYLKFEVISIGVLIILGAVFAPLEASLLISAIGIAMILYRAGAALFALENYEKQITPKYNNILQRLQKYPNDRCGWYDSKGTFRYYSYDTGVNYAIALIGWLRLFWHWIALALVLNIM